MRRNNPGDRRYEEQTVAPPGDLQWRPEGDDWIAWGTCPVCAHRTEKELVDLVPGTVTKGKPWGRKKPEVRRERTMDCTCDITHRGAEERRGCGASWTVRLPDAAVS
ncbi:hypothetical protein [Streptomyces sp. NPDC053431]|uniref:hypothetical protein n=1 Tax=Streptomyces sp. NPDC053431 TaxID=3365703 RepID=UPI0037D73666